ncbi:MAG: Gfo/Idh/MocA family oxidoreductase [Burkholderiaceae bacterium]|nr:Gfo/Idh/MocA family oxidoreductase [Microbacteriaceae bacterium]
MDGGPVRIGLIGCGNVSRQYLLNIAGRPGLVVVACADIVPESALSVSREFGIQQVCTVDQLLAHPHVDLVLNLTLPIVHAAISLRALDAGKHVYSEKPFALSVEDARSILELARERGLQVGCAPDTFMGVGIRACAELIQLGELGTLVAANAFMMNAGPERFHPSPEFLYRQGAGPLLDIGPYYATALVELLGPVARVGSLGSTTRSVRTILSGDRAGTSFPVETPTHIVSLLQFGSGALGTLVTSFDVAHTRTPRLEIHGTEGSIVASAANSWAGPVLLKRAGDDDFVEIPLDPTVPDGGYLGMGLVEMASAVRHGRAPVASGERALHVLEVLVAILDSTSSGGSFADIHSSPATRSGARQDAR